MPLSIAEQEVYFLTVFPIQKLPSLLKN